MPKCPSCGTDTPAESGFCNKFGNKIFAAAGQLSPNTILEGRYRYIIVEATGKVSMGPVYKAFSSRLLRLTVLMPSSEEMLKLHRWRMRVVQLSLPYKKVWILLNINRFVL